MVALIGPVTNFQGCRALSNNLLAVAPHLGETLKLHFIFSPFAVPHLYNLDGTFCERVLAIEAEGGDDRALAP